MSKQGKRKITVELPKTKELINRPSVFERLGTKKKASVKKTTEYCRQWVLHGSCAYGKSCKFAVTHTLISPSKRAANKDNEIKRFVKDDARNRLHSTVVVRPGRSPDGEIDNWDQNDLEYADTDVLEKRRLQLQRELEIQLKMDTGKDMRKDKKKPISSSSSSRSSSSSSVSSSSSDGSSSSSSTGRDVRRKGKKGKLKRRSSSSTDGDVPAKKKIIKSESNRKDKNESKKTTVKKDDRLVKKHDSSKKKELSKVALSKKSLSPGKKSGGTPPITKNASKNVPKHAKSPQKRERNRTVSPHSAKDRENREKDRDRGKEKERDKDRDKDRDRIRGRSRSPRKGRSRSPRRHSTHSKDTRRKSSDRSRPISPKKPVRRDTSSEKPRKRTVSRGREHKDKSLERRKDKPDDKDRHERKDRGRERIKDNKRDDVKRRGRERGLGGRGGGSDKGLEKPSKPMERLLPRPEERLAALAISNRVLDADKGSTSKERQDTHSDKGGRKQERNERDRSSKRDRLNSLDRDPGDYDIERQYEHGHGMDHYDRADDRYDDVPREDNRSPGYAIQGRERHYEPGYEMSGPSRGYPEDDDRIYGDRIAEHRGVDIGYDDRRPHRDSWEGRSSSVDHDRGFIHPHKEWENEDYRPSGEWGRDRHWPMHEPQMGEWGDKEPEMEGWHHRAHPPGPHRGRVQDDYNRGMRMDVNRGEPSKRRPRNDQDITPKDTPPPVLTVIPVLAMTPRQEPELDDNPIPDDLSEISDDPDDILNREDMIDQNIDEDSQPAQTVEEGTSKTESSEKESTQDTSGLGEEKESQDASKDEEDVTNMDFEEISDGELEEERTRAGLGDALGVDWASLVADVRRREQVAPSSGARERWKPERVLTRVGLSLEMAGKDTVKEILQKNAESIDEEQKSLQNAESGGTTEQNGKDDVTKNKVLSPDVESLHPVAAIQVAVEKRKRQRAVLFGSGCEITRALSARRDLALRRYLCQLPAAERAGQSRAAPQPALFNAAKALLMQTPV